MSVLLLNSSFEPMALLTRNRALVLVLQGKAEVLETTGTKINSEKRSFDIPSVLRLKYFVNIPYKAKLPLNRRNLFARDDHECQFAGCHRKGTTIDHVVPRSRGGRHEWNNVIAACKKCNFKKSDKMLAELGWTLKKQPQAPTGARWILSGRHERPEWKPYLDNFATV